MKKNRGRYQNDEKKQAKKAAKRKYMSYEDVPLEDYRDDVVMPNNLTRRFLKMFLILFLAVVAVLAVLNIEKLTPENIAHWFQYDLLGKSEGDGYPTGFTGSTVSNGNFQLISGVPVYCSDTSITVLNSNAGVCQELQHSYAKPMMSVNGGYGIIYNLDATGYTIIKRDTTERTNSVKQKILAGDISSNGVYALLTRSDDYLASLTVYRTDNTEKYRYSFADYYMNTVSINNDGTRAILSGVSARNGGLISVIYILDFSQDTYMQKYEVDDAFIYEVKFLDNGSAYAVGSTKAFYINVSDGNKIDLDYLSRTLTAYSIKRDQGLLLSLSTNPDGRECDVLSYNRSGERDSDFPTGQKIISLDMNGGTRGILTGDKVILYDKGGTETQSAEVDPDSRKLLFSDRSTCYILGKSRISQLKL